VYSNAMHTNLSSCLSNASAKQQVLVVHVPCKSQHHGPDGGGPVGDVGRLNRGGTPNMGAEDTSPAGPQPGRGTGGGDTLVAEKGDAVPVEDAGVTVVDVAGDTWQA
jgi:hypothetical protein